MALKLTEFFFRKPGMTTNAFLSHWQEQHTEVVSAIEGLRRYVQNPAAGLLEGRPNPFDGMVEVWFDDFAAVERVQQSDYWNTIVDDELRFVDRPTMQLFFSEEPLPERYEAGFKQAFRLDPTPGTSLETFRSQATRALEAPRLSGLRGIQRQLPASLPGNPPACAGALEIWRFESLVALEAGMKSPAARAVCDARQTWATAREPHTAEERVIR